jgi:multidrug efflux system membrane fusion protein
MGQPAINLPQSVKLAGIIVALAALYFLARGIFSGGDISHADSTPQGRFVVIANSVSPKVWQAEVVIRGRTEAEKKVVVRDETASVPAETPAELGSMVNGGDVLCRVNIDARQALLAEARAAFAKTQLDYDAAVRLNAEGFRAETAVAAAKAARDQAAAQVERARIELSKTEIIAPFDGVFDHRVVETGDFVKIGDPCGTVI